MPVLRPPLTLHPALFQSLAALSLAPGLARLTAPRATQEPRPEVAPTHLEPGEGPRIDGRLDEPLWQRAALLGELTVTEPVEGATPARPTEVRLAYDRDFLYVAFVCFDEPENVRARQMDRDANIQYDDVVELWVDTFDTQRFAFWFQLSAGGSRGDALLADAGSSFNKSWDGIWYGRSLLTERGWQGELALPFKTLAFAEGARTWGFNLTRKRVVNGEESRWASPRVAYRFFDLTVGGRLTGLEGMYQGWGLDVVPYAKLGTAREDEDDDFATTGDLGLDVNWRPTPETNLRLTFNTDFAETEVDDRPTNLTRFPLFFPEKRGFFLEDAGLFEFGPSGGGGGSRGLLPFFSRTIGRDDDGRPIPILAGAKLTGRLGDWNVGFLDVFVDERDAEVGERNLGVLRVSKNLGGENAVGVLLTGGDPDSERSAATYGADFRLGAADLFGDGRRGTLWGWWLGSRTEGEGDGGAAYGVEALARSSAWEHRASARVVEEGFDPALGFVRRQGAEDYQWQTGYTWRGPVGSGVRRMQWNVEPSYTVDRVGDEDAWEVPVTWLELELASEDELRLESTRLFERLDQPFEIGDLEVPAGEHFMTRHSIELETNSRRLWKSRLGVEWGDFFGGDLLRTSFAPLVVPGRHVLLDLEVEDVRIDLEGDELNRVVYGANVDFTFTPDLYWKNLVQYDTTSNDLGWQSRVRWTLSPGQDLFVVALLGWNKEEHDSAFRTTAQDLAIKLSYTLRF